MICNNEKKDCTVIIIAFPNIKTFTPRWAEEMEVWMLDKSSQASINYMTHTFW